MNNTIEVIVNQVKMQLAENSTLSYLLAQKSINTTGIAVAVNQQIIPKTAWDTTILQHNDHILIIHASQGG